MPPSLELEVTGCQAPQVTSRSGTLARMSPTQLRRRTQSPGSAEDLRLGFSARLNELLDEHNVPPKGKGRQEAAKALFKPFLGEFSQKGVRKWLEAEAIPEFSRVIQLAQFFDVQVEWLLTGRGDRKYLTTVSEKHARLIKAYDKADPSDRMVVDLTLGLASAP
jgi:hypothetical protein